MTQLEHDPSLIIWHYKSADDSDEEWGEWHIMANNHKIGQVFHKDQAQDIIDLMNDLENKLNIQKLKLLFQSPENTIQ